MCVEFLLWCCLCCRMSIKHQHVLNIRWPPLQMLATSALPCECKLAVGMVTGAAGFVGMHTSIALKNLGMTPIGYDNVNEYYSVKLKESRIRELKKNGIDFVRGDVCDATALKRTIQEYKITRFIHLAAQGMRTKFL